MRFLTRSLAILAVAATAIACDDPGPTAPTDDDTAPVSFTETFSGALSRNGAVTFPFVSTAAGTATATLNSVLPDATLPLGFAMGTWNGSSCQLVLSNDNARQSTTLVGTVGGAGSLCLRVYDIGRVTTTVTFTVSVVHF